MYLTLFLNFVKIGMFTIGGGYAMIPLIEREIVKRQWMTKEDFMQMFAITQSLPGVFAVNISIFVGYRLKGFWGSLVCALGTILPSFAIILIIALLFRLPPICMIHYLLFFLYCLSRLICHQVTNEVIPIITRVHEHTFKSLCYESKNRNHSDLHQY